MQHEALERQADQVADRVLGDEPAGALQPAAPVLQRSADGNAAPPAHVPASVERTLAEPGRPLQPGVRRDMERRFGHDFSNVRVHTGASASTSARDVDAQAYTVGSHVVFANGKFQPERTDGRRLLAHELTHVVQQGNARRAGVLRYAPQTDQSSPAEQEAERNAERVEQPGRLRVRVRDGGAPRLRRAPNSPGGCGVCMSPAIAGTAVHVEVASMFRALGGMAETRISAPGGGRGRRGRLDLALINEKTRTIYLGEVKPDNARGAKTGRRDQAFYRRLIALDRRYATYFARNMTAREFTPTPGFIKNLRMPGCPGQTVTITPSAHGVYLYKCSPDATTLEAQPICACKKRKKKKNKKKKKSKARKQAKSKQKKAPKKGPKKAPKKMRRPKKPAAPKPKPKPKSVGGAYNVGFGLSIFSVGGGVGNAGVGVSILSTSTGFGTAGAGVSILSDSLAAGTASVGVSVQTEGAAAGSVGAGVTKESMGASAGTAGAGTADKTAAAAAGAAGAGKVEESELAAAGSAGSGTVKGSQVTGTGGTGSGKLENVQGSGSGSATKPVDAKDVQGRAGGTARGTQPAGDKAGTSTQATGDKAGAGTRPAGDKAGADAAGSSESSGSGARADQRPSGTADATAAGTAKGGTPGTGTPGAGTTDAAQQGQAAGGTAGGDLQAQIAALLGAADPSSKPDDRAKAAAEAVKIHEMLKGATNAQKGLLARLARQSGNQYAVPASDWVEKLLQATKGITEDDLEYLATLDWTPAKISAEELRKKIQKVLENKKPKSDAQTADAGKAQDTSNAAAKDKPGGGAGQGAGAGAKKDKGSAPAGEGSKGGPESGTFTVARPFKGNTQIQRDYQFAINDSITPQTKVGDKVVMTLQWIGDDRRAYYYKLAYVVSAGPTPVPDKKISDLVWLYFTLKSQNTEAIDIALESHLPFVIRPGAEASYRIEKPKP